MTDNMTPVSMSIQFDALWSVMHAHTVLKSQVFSQLQKEYALRGVVDDVVTIAHHPAGSTESTMWPSLSEITSCLSFLKGTPSQVFHPHSVIELVEWTGCMHVHMGR